MAEDEKSSHPEGTPNPSDREMTLIEHLEELRKRLLIAAVAVLIATPVSFFLTRWIFDVLKLPLGDYRQQLIYIEITEMFTTYFKVAIFTALGLAMPMIVYQLVAFMAPALTPKEKRYLYILLPGVMVAFLTGALFGYFVLVPPAIRFLLTFGTDIAQPQIRIGNYISVVSSLIFWLGVSFELPIVLFFLAKIRLINSRWLIRQWRYALVVAFVVAAIITPTPDPFNQTIVALPLLLLYGISIVLTRFA